MRFVIGIRRLLSVGGAFSLYFAAMTRALAQQPDVPAPPALSVPLDGEAKTAFDTGITLFDSGDFRNAREKFLRTHELASDYQLMWNVLVCEINLHRYGRALEALETYLREGRGKLAPAEIERANDVRTKLERLVVVVTVLVSEPGATVTLDGERVGTTPMSSPIRVDLGERIFRIEKEGFRPFDMRHKFTDAGTFVVTAKLDREWHRGTLVVEARAKDAILLDGKVVALGRYEGLVASGGHSLQVRAPGMLTEQSEIVVKDGETRRISVALNPVPKVPDIAQWAWIGAGSAVFVGAVAIGAMLFQPTKAPEVMGTVGTVPVPSSWSRP